MPRPDVTPGGGFSGQIETVYQPLPYETRRFAERVVVTPEALMTDNRSERAYEGRQEWEDARKRSALVGVWACADSRLMIPHAGTLRVRSIATGGPEQPYTNIFTDPGIEKAVILAHFAGPAEAGSPPKGCGGLGAKAEHVLAAEEGNEGNLERFVGEHIASPDALLQAWVSASNTAERTGKPVLAAIQDHIDGRILPVAAFEDRGRRIATAVPVQHMLQGQYHPERIYEEGIPVLSGNEVPDTFYDFLSKGSEQISTVHDEYPELETMQQVQSPEVVVISTEARPIQVCFPNTFKRPGSAFKISVPRNKIDATVPINPQDLQIALAQAEYPIRNSIASKAHPDAAFAHTNTFFIETGSLRLSDQLAQALLEQEWMQEWTQMPGRQVLIAQMREGVAHQIKKVQLS